MDNETEIPLESEGSDLPPGPGLTRPDVGLIHRKREPLSIVALVIVSPLLLVLAIWLIRLLLVH